MTEIQKKRRAHPELLDGAALDVARKLIADLIGEKDYSPEQGHFRLKPEMLPEEMNFERAVLRVMDSFIPVGMAPTEENLLLRLSLEYEDATNQMMRLVSHRSPRRNVTALAMSLSEHTGRSKMALALSEAQKVLRQGGLSNVVVYEQITELLSAAAPRSRIITSRAADSLFEEVWDYQKKMSQQHAQGYAVGPNFPWQNLNALIPFLSPGDMTLIAAQTGFGKSITAQQISEHIAHTIGGYDVGFFHLETTGLDFMMRLGCRLLPLHGSDFFHAQLSDRKVAQRIEMLQDEYRRAQRERGAIYYEESYGIGWEDFKNKVTLGKIRAEAAGKRYVCMVDYYQKFGSSGFANRTEAYNSIAENLKDLAQQLGIYMIVFSQEQPHTQKSAPGGEVSEGELSSWGGNVINFQSQVIIRLIRKRNAESDSIWMEADDKTPRRDALGKTMYLHRKGQIDSASKFKVIKASFGQVGDAHVVFANGFFDIADADVTQFSFTD